MHRTVVQIVVYFVMTVTSNIFLGIFSNGISQLPANEIIPQWRRFRVRVTSARLSVCFVSHHRVSTLTNQILN